LASFAAEPCKIGVYLVIFIHTLEYTFQFG
jgi:hypothetical protein